MRNDGVLTDSVCLRHQSLYYFTNDFLISCVFCPRERVLGVGRWRGRGAHSRTEFIKALIAKTRRINDPLGLLCVDSLSYVILCTINDTN